jgi:hypothetical protein|uniref:Uncharacterized protein n=1 Tax=Sipha flava TaxID=143950 RepID=A0A2S2PXI7_9HEMI
MKKENFNIMMTTIAYVIITLSRILSKSILPRMYSFVAKTSFFFVDILKNACIVYLDENNIGHIKKNIVREKNQFYVVIFDIVTCKNRRSRTGFCQIYNIISSRKFEHKT